MPTLRPDGFEPGSALRYGSELDLGSDSAGARVVRLVGGAKRVLELGCASGHMSRALRGLGCTVVGVELDPVAAERAATHCERVVQGDLDRIDLAQELAGERFDAVVAADVLEHLKRPARLLESLVPLLRPQGFLVASLPNVAHGSVRLALLQGRFPYSDHGLLDRTHLRFFDRDSALGLFRDAGYAVSHLERVLCGLDQSEVVWDEDLVPEGVGERLARDLDAMTYQFVIACRPMPPAPYTHFGEGLHHLVVEKDDVERGLLAGPHDQLQARDDEIRRLVEEAAHLQLKLDQGQRQLRLALATRWWRLGCFLWRIEARVKRWRGRPSGGWPITDEDRGEP